MAPTLAAFYNRRPRIVEIGLIGTLSLPLLAHMIAGFSTRLLADDYCVAHEALTRGWWGTMIYWFNNWTGVYASTGTKAAIILVPGTSFVAILPALLLVTWLVGMVWGIYQIGQIVGLRRPVFASFLLGSLILFAIVEGVPNIFQALYWASGSITYVLPLVILTYYTGFILYTLRRSPPGNIPGTAVVISLAMTLIAGGYSPIYAALQGALLALAILLCLRYAPGTLKRSLLWLLVAGLLGGIVAILLMFASPGNTLRQQNFPPPPQLPELVAKNLWGSLAFSALTIAIFAPLGILITMVFSGLTASQLLGVTSRTQVIVKRNRLRLLSLIAVMGFGLINAALLPATYGTSTLPAARGFIIPHFILIFVAVAWGIVMGISVQKPTVTSEHPNRLPFSTAGVVILAILIFIGPIRAAWNTVSVIPELQTFAEEWDQIDREIRAAVQAGVTELEIAPLLVDMAVHVDVESLSTDADSGFNRCAADYYGLDSLTAPASDPAGDEG